MISIPYSRSNGIYTFTDAIVLEDDVYATMTSEEITTMQDNRFANWLSHLEASCSSEPEAE